MIIRLGFAPRARGLSPAQAQEHWRGTHGWLAAGLPGLRRYVQNHPVLEGGRTLLPYPGFDVFAETEFDSVGSMEAAFASDLYQRTITDDERELIQRDRFSLALTERRVRIGGDPGEGAVKLITLLRAHPARSRGALLEALEGEYASRVADHGPLRHEQLIALPDQDSALDAADEIWFGDPVEALAYATSEAAGEAGLAIAGLALGREQVIVRPVLIAGPRLP